MLNPNPQFCVPVQSFSKFAIIQHCAALFADLANKLNIKIVSH